MIELEDEEGEFEVEVVAVVGVKRTVRVKARGDSHAREVAKQMVRAETEPQEWTAPSCDTLIRVDPERITHLMTGMCPKRV